MLLVAATVGGRFGSSSSPSQHEFLLSFGFVYSLIVMPPEKRDFDGNTSIFNDAGILWVSYLSNYVLFEKIFWCGPFLKSLLNLL